MKVKCISEKISDENNPLFDWGKNTPLELTVGKVYVVLAISSDWNSIVFYVLGDERDNFPLAFPAELFEIVDGTVSKYWDSEISQIISLKEIEIQNREIMSFKEWKLKRDQFYENVLEELDPDYSTFKNYRDNMLNE